MSFRNDAGALLARAEALERENRELRKQIAEREDLDDVEEENKKLQDELAQLRDLVSDKETKAEALEAKERAKARAAKETARKLARDNRGLKKRLGTDKWRQLLWLIYPASFAMLYAFCIVHNSRTTVSAHISLGKRHISALQIVPGSDGGPVASVLFVQERNRRKGRATSSLPPRVQLTSFDLFTGKRGDTLTV